MMASNVIHTISGFASAAAISLPPARTAPLLSTRISSCAASAFSTRRTEDSAANIFTPLSRFIESPRLYILLRWGWRKTATALRSDGHEETRPGPDPHCRNRIRLPGVGADAGPGRRPETVVVGPSLHRLLQGLFQRRRSRRRAQILRRGAAGRGCRGVRRHRYRRHRLHRRPVQCRGQRCGDGGGGQSREQPGYPLIGYFATAKAYAGGLTKPTDLAGKRIAITQAGSSFHYSLGLLADKDHFALSGVHLVPLQSLSNIAAALKGGQVDGALLPVTTALPLMASGDIKLLGWVGNETPWQLGAVFVSKGEMQHRDIVAKFLAAYRLGARDYHDILLASIKDGRAQIDDKTRPLIDSIVRYTHLKPEQVVVGLSYIDRDGMLDVPGVAKQLVWFQANHFVDDGFGVQQVVDESFGFAR